MGLYSEHAHFPNSGTSTLDFSNTTGARRERGAEATAEAMRLRKLLVPEGLDAVKTTSFFWFEDLKPNFGLCTHFGGKPGLNRQPRLHLCVTATSRLHDLLYRFGGCKIRGTLVWVSIIRIIVFWGQNRGPPILGSSHLL